MPRTLLKQSGGKASAITPCSSPAPTAMATHRSTAATLQPRPAHRSTIAPALALAVGGMPGWIEAAARLDSLASWPAFLAAASAVTALLGAGLFATSLVLMLRVGWLERAFGGLDRLYLAHHLTGVAAFLALLLHPLALGLGHLLAGSPTAALVATVPDPARPAALLGWIALVWLMAMLTATFAARLSFSGWKRLHASSGIAFLLAIAHIIAVGPRPGLAYPVLALWMAAGLAALLGRALIDRAAVDSYGYVVAQVRQLADEIIELRLSPLRRRLVFVPGQFVFAAFYDYADYRGCAEYHPFTIASHPDETELRLIVKALGDCTLRMQDVRPGVAARVQGPFGAFLERADPDRPQVWIAGGIGITPFLAKLRALPELGPPIHLYYAVGSASDAVCLPELECIAAGSGRFRLTALFADRGEMLTAVRVAAENQPLEQNEFLICGPPAMVEQLAQGLLAAGVARDRVQAERFDFR